MTQFRPSSLFRAANRMVAPLIRTGIPMGVKRAPMALLTVPGRRTGISRSTPVALAAIDEGWLLVAVYGVCDWSRNLEVAGQGTITTKGRSTDVHARRLEPGEAAPLLRESIADAPAMIRRMTARYFSAKPDSPIEEWQREAIDHPVFILTPTN